MNKFRTVVATSKFPFKISHKQQIMCIGSCFTEHIGGFLSKSKFDTRINPFGIIYNPISTCTALNRLVDGDLVTETELVVQNDRYYHWDFHGDFSGSSSAETVQKLNESITSGMKFIDEIDILFITLGTANGFNHISENRIVANCHKFPNDQFDRIALSVQQIKEELSEVILKLQNLRSDLKVIFTVSPVRHIRDGLVENQLSKAKLIQVVHVLKSALDNVFYFPSYELVMDDLRDYRFYKEDMIHINKTGLDYIWSYFQNSFFDTETIELNKELTKVQKDLSHKPFYPESENHQKFLKQLLQKIQTLKSNHPHLNFGLEEKGIKDQILN